MSASLNKSRSLVLSLALLLSAAMGPLASSLPAQADTAPPTGTPATVSVDALPTVGVNGGVWAEAISGNTVYATGQFTTATNPNGTAYTRGNLIAFDITTGNLITSFNHSLTCAAPTSPTRTCGRAISVSPDGKTLYVGGKFTAADGQARRNLAAFDLTTNTLVPGFTDGPAGTVMALASTNSNVYVGGSFTATNSNIPRSRLAEYSTAGALNPTWKPAIAYGPTGSGYSASVQALVVAGNNVVIGGSFSLINGGVFYGSGAVDATSGATIGAWASQSGSYPIHVNNDGASITSLSYDGSQVYITMYAFHDAAGDEGGTFEGRAAISPTTGSIIWLNNCYGDTYDAIPIGQVLYSVSHAHDCSAIGAYPAGASRRALAETTYATGINKVSDVPGRISFPGVPDSTQLDWYPDLDTGKLSGSNQAAWAITGNANFIALGGEFNHAQGNSIHHGLVRYGIASAAPNKFGPVAYATPAITAGIASSAGNATVSTRPTWDPDNSLLHYVVYRDGKTAAICTKDVNSRYWFMPSFNCTDTGLAPGTKGTYYVVVTDNFGNTITGLSQ